MRIGRLDGRGLVAWSGGPDSTALVHLMLEAGCDIAAAHVNYGLRGDESDEDENFVRQTAERLGIALYVHRADMTRLRGRSLQEAARILRYDYFRRLVEAQNYTYVALGHTADDDVETRMYSLLRSKHFNPLAGIPPVRTPFVRPLLVYTRKDVMRYLESRGIPYRTDSSNLKTDYLRNKIRLEVLPKLAEINPSYAENILSAGAVSDAQARMLRRIFVRSGVLENDFLDLEKLARYEKRYGPDFRRLFFLQRLKEMYGFNASEVETVLRLADAQTGKSARLGGISAVRERNGIAFLRSEPEVLAPLVIAGGVGEGRFGKFRIFWGTENLPGKGFRADYERLKFPLSVRFPQHGDAFVPLGMKGRKKVFDLLAEMKVPAAEKKYKFAVEDSDGIVYVEGYRPAERVKVTDSTKVEFHFRFSE